MKYQRVDILFSAFLVLMAITACARKATPAPTETPTPGLAFPTGHFTNSDWTWDFKADGTFISSGVPGAETGTYIVTGDQVEITCQCCGNVKGTYRWSFDGQTLTFHAIDDACFDRLNVVSSGVWTLSP